MSTLHFNKVETAAQAIDFLKSFYGLDSDLALCNHIGLSHSTINQWRKRESVPQWVFFIIGELQQIRNHQQNETPGEHTIAPINQTAMLSASVDALLEHLDESERALFFATTQEIEWKKKVLSELKEMHAEIASLRKELKK